MNEHELIIAAVAGTIIIFALISFVLTQLLLFQRRRQRHQTELKQMEGQYNEEILKTRLEIQEQTFRAISQEVHDNIGQMLSLAKLHLNTLNLANSNRNQQLEEIKDLVAKSIQDLRDLSKSLNADSINVMGLPKALEVEVSRLQKTGTVNGMVTITGTVHKLNGQKELILYRIAQEALQNIIKHAEASQVTVHLDYRDEALSMVISDNGNGFAQTGEESEGSGLRNISYRATLIGATVQISSQPGRGTSIHLHLPLKTI